MAAQRTDEDHASAPPANLASAFCMRRERAPAGPLWPNPGLPGPLALTPQRFGLWPSLGFWWNREHLELAFPVILPVLIPGLALTQMVCLLLGAFVGDSLAAFLAVSAFGGISTLAICLVSLGLLERHIRKALRKTEQPGLTKLRAPGPEA